VISPPQSQAKSPAKGFVQSQISEKKSVAK